MKKKIFGLYFIFCLGLIHAQISSRATTASKPAAVPVYDSLQDMITYENVQQFVGQSIYLVPKSTLYEAAEKHVTTGYFSFVYEPKGEEFNTYKRVNLKYANGYQNQVSDYATMNGKYYKIMEVLDQTDVSIFKDRNYQGVFFRLEGREKQELLYYRFSTEGKTISWGDHEGFIFEGLYEKAKQTYLHKKFYADYSMFATDLNTGEVLKNMGGTLWTCSDVTLIERKNKRFQVMALILKDSAAHEIAVCLNPRISGFDLKITDFKSEELVKEELRLQKEKEKQTVVALKARKSELVKKYGTKYGPIIAEGKVCIGMTKKMCIEAWGEPHHINKTALQTSFHEQWVYSLRSYIYFDDNVLTAIQSTE